VIPPARYAGFEVLPNQLSDAKGDHVYYSVRRVFELLLEANPTMVELIYTPPDCVLHCDGVMQPLFDARALTLTQALVRAKLGYAMGQIKKARGQNKWINQPQPESPPRPEQFCYWISALAGDAGALPARPKPLAQLPVPIAHCHVARVEHGGQWYRLYHIGAEARGVFRGDGLPVCESISKEQETQQFIGLMSFNEQGFQKAKLDHHNYWRWRAERNDARWLAQERGQLDYDAKNLMHCMRLLFSARQVLTHGAPLVRVEGAERDELLAIRAGQFSYRELIVRAENLVAQCEQELSASLLPETVDSTRLSALFWQICARAEAAHKAL
jgi:uncharacterized protein